MSIYLDPENNTTLRGTIYSDPKFFTTKNNGQEFKCSFILKVMEKHMSMGKDGANFIGFNLIPIDYYGPDRMQWCHQFLRKGAEVSAMGPLASSLRDGKYQLTVIAQHIINVRDFEKPSMTNYQTQSPVIQKELPY